MPSGRRFNSAKDRLYIGVPKWKEADVYWGHLNNRFVQHASWLKEWSIGGEVRERLLVNERNGDDPRRASRWPRGGVFSQHVMTPLFLHMVHSYTYLSHHTFMHS